MIDSTWESATARIFSCPDVTDVCRELGDEVQIVKILWRTPFALSLESEAQWLVIRRGGEMTGLKHLSEVSHGIADRLEFPVVDAVFLLRRAEFPGKARGWQTPCTRWTAPMVVVQASLTRASGAFESGVPEEQLGTGLLYIRRKL